MTYFWRFLETLGKRSGFQIPQLVTVLGLNKMVSHNTWLQKYM